MKAAEPKTNKLLKDAVYQHRWFSRQGFLERAFAAWFNGFVYNQIWEDPRVDVEAMRLTPQSRILSISSGGCNILNYLTHSPEKIVAVDLNRCHMSLTRLKLAALEHLPDYDAFFRFFGHANDAKNVENYGKYIRENLDPETRRFWDGNSLLARLLFRGKRIKMFSKNLYDHAKLGLLLRFLHTWGKLTRHNPKRLLETHSQEEQERIFDETINPFFDNRLVRLVGRVPLIYFSLGIPPQQLKALRSESDDHIVDLYRDRIKRLACGFPLEDNYFAHQAFGRSYDVDNQASLPDYLKAENYDNLKANVGRVETHIASMIDFVKGQPDHSLDRFVFLDAQDWMKPAQLDELWSGITRVGDEGTRIIFRTASSMSPIEESLSSEVRTHYHYDVDLSKALHVKDRSAIYGGFHVYELRKPGESSASEAAVPESQDDAQTQASEATDAPSS